MSTTTPAAFTPTRRRARSSATRSIKKNPNENVALVSDTIIEEVLQDIGTLDFGDGV
jgi:urease gamma subunit